MTCGSTLLCILAAQSIAIASSRKANHLAAEMNRLGSRGCRERRTRLLQGIRQCVSSDHHSKLFSILDEAIRQAEEVRDCGTASQSLIWTPDKPSRGMGDVIAKITNAVGIRPCGGCKKRQEAINRALPFRNAELNSQNWPALTAVPIDQSQLVSNVLYHVMPWAGRGIWQWNLDQLLRRIVLFNGRRVMAISTGPNCDPPEAVMQHTKGHGFEFIVRENVPKLREVVTFLPLLEIVQSLNPNEVTFYAHAKGVTHAGFWDDGNPIKPWTEAMYETCLDNWDAVKDALESHAICGSFKRYGKFTTPGNNRWHFSGTFYWFRNKDVFSRNWRRVDQKFFGTESWPGLMFKQNEAACLFHDNCSDLYKIEYQRSSVYPELEKWRNAR